MKGIDQIPRHHQITATNVGCSLWWLEYGGRMDTIHDTEEIKWELWKVAYGVWDYLKNSGKFPETETHTLEWIGAIPGKRESRRFEGDYVLSQSDIVEQKRHDDAVSFGGWAIDLHPADGLYSDKPGCTQYHSKGVYQIPYRCMYSRNIANLFIAGRLISASHVAFGSTRVMMTTAHNAQAVGMAAVMCKEENLSPRDLVDETRMKALQTRLLRTGQFVPHLEAEDTLDLAQQARITTSSEHELARFAPSGETLLLDSARALLIPANAGPFPEVTLYFTSEEQREIEVQLRVSEREGNFTPDRVLATKMVTVRPGSDVPTPVVLDVEIDKSQYAFVCIMPCEGVSIALSNDMLTGVMSLVHSANKKVATSAVQTPPEGSGFDTFEFWLPERRPAGKLLAAEFSPPIRAFGADQLRTGYNRPFVQSNAWVADRKDGRPVVTLAWNTVQAIRTIKLFFDVDYDHAMESVQFGHHDHAMPYCVKAFQIIDDKSNVIFSEADNHQAMCNIRLNEPVVTKALRIEILETRNAPAALFGVRCYK